MSSGQAVLWLVAIVVALALALYGMRLMQQGKERRARMQRYQRLGRESGPQRALSQPAALYSSMGPDRAAAIRQDAEAAARLVASGQASQPRNPHAEGSPEYVLWVATYHLTLTELADEAAPSEAVEWKAGPAGRTPGPT